LKSHFIECTSTSDNLRIDYLKEHVTDKIGFRYTIVNIIFKASLNSLETQLTKELGSEAIGKSRGQ
jgi:hypothetical protein